MKLKHIVISIFAAFVLCIAIDAKVTTIFKPNVVGVSAPVGDGDASHYFNGLLNFADPFAAMTLDYMPVWNASVKQMQNSSFRQLGGRQWQLEGNGGSSRGKLWLYDLFATNQIDAAIMNGTTVNATTVNTANINTTTINGDTFNFNGGGGGVLQGHYVPTVTPVANCTLVGVSTFDAMYFRVGNLVSVDTRVQVTVTAAGTFTQFRMSLPIGVDLTYAFQVSGVGMRVDPGTTATATSTASVEADATANEALVSFVCQGNTGTSGTYNIHFAYVTLY